MNIREAAARIPATIQPLPNSRCTSRAGFAAGCPTGHKGDAAPLTSKRRSYLLQSS
jgi:hypothetical protein